MPLATLFWVSLAVLAYIYVGYPLLIGALARVFGRAPRGADTTPRVTLFIPAYNEAAHIEAKLRNSLALDYPRDRLSIVVASDGSTDGTDAIVARYAGQGVRLLRMPQNAGKAAMLDALVPALTGEVLVFSDASSELAPEAVRRLVQPFADASVGCVSGLYRLKATGTTDLRGEGEGLYWTYETWIKRQESRLHSILGAHGALYAIRQALFEPLGNTSINDDYLIPMRIVARGFRAVYEPAAVAWEREVASVEGEFARRRRIAMGNCQQIIALRQLLSPRAGWVAFSFFSHKVLRTLAPAFLVTMLAASVALPQPWQAAALGAQALLYGSAWVGYVCQQRGHAPRWLSPPLYFCLGNLAMGDGLLRYLAGQRTAWNRPASADTLSATGRADVG